MRHRVELVPSGARLELEHGAPLHKALFPYGVEFPCGGAGTCGGCRVRVLAGHAAVTPEMELALTGDQIAAGWRLACRARVESPLTLEVGQWSGSILSDDSRFAFEPAEGAGIAIDLGTTTLVAQLVDLRTGAVLAVETARNVQAAHGADGMSRIDYALRGGAARLTGLIRAQLGKMIAALPGSEAARAVVIVGNTAMHHLFCGIDVAPLAHVPFEPVEGGEHRFSGVELGWEIAAEVRFPACLGGFVGSDVGAGIMTTPFSNGVSALIDLGTNGEIVVGNGGKLLCASTAAGPAFEGGRIRMGMTASSGAISRVTVRDGALECQTVDGAPARGICGSGLVDAVAAGLDLGIVLPSGRLRAGLELTPAVALTQQDIRELQLAKAAIAAGLRVLLKRWGSTVDDLDAVRLAGAFGNYVDVESARRIGLLEMDPRSVVPSGNTALRGAKMALLGAGRPVAAEHVSLGSDAEFQETFVECMGFSAGR